MRLTPAVIVCLLLLVATPPAARAGDRLDVATESGVVRGIATAHGPQWRGIPYAAAPVGSRRWKPPRRAPSWDGVRAADRFAPQCIQLISETETKGREDCLYLNVFAPPDARPGAPVPVMVHLHGGGNGFGRAYRDASAFVDRGVLVVTLQYRLGIFGFMGHPALTAEAGRPSGEYALLDQISALRWVKRNIAAFGGDPHNVTLFGVSAGSFDAAALVASPLAIGLFRRAALQTESVWAGRGIDKIEIAEDWGREVAHARCRHAVDLLRCLRRAPASELVRKSDFLDLQPWVGGDVLPASPLKLIERQTSTVPLLVGSNREETAGWFFPHTFLGEPYPKRLWIKDTDDLTGAGTGDRVRALYRPYRFDSRLWAAVAAYTDAVYTCPIRRLATISDGPVWRYLYTHRYANHEDLRRMRAAHFHDEPMLWHDRELLRGFGAADYQFSDAEKRLSKQMTSYWVNFAKTGNPNGPGLPAWPQYTQDGERILVLHQRVRVIDHWRSEACRFFDHQEAPPNDIPRR
jgi:para-nitrobenzyl esterase